MNGTSFTSRKGLVACPWKNLDRCIGIRVSTAFTHAGFSPPRECVEIERETIAVTTSTSVELAVDATDWKPTARGMTESIITDLDEVIAELTAHRARLKDSLKEIAAA